MASMTRWGVGLGCAAVVALGASGCTPPQDHMALVRTHTMQTGSSIAASVGGDVGPELRDLDGLQMLVAPLVDRGSRAWDAMPSNMEQGRVLPGTALVHTYVTHPVDLAPGDYALWFRWGAGGDEHTDGYGLLKILP